MNNDTVEETKWQNLKEKRQHEQLQARACGYSEAPRGARHHRARGEHQTADPGRWIAEKGGDQQVSTATRILAEVIASDTSWLMVFNGAIDYAIYN